MRSPVGVPVPLVRPFVLASLVVLEPGRGRRRRVLPPDVVVFAPGLSWAFSPNRVGGGR